MQPTPGLALSTMIRARAAELGFSTLGIAPARQPPEFERLRAWVDQGYAAGMHYFANRLDAYASPSKVLPGAKSIVMFTANYSTVPAAEPQPGEGRIARYAWSDDYHDVLRDKLNQLQAALQISFPDAAFRGVVDTAPLMERDFAVLAGLGWKGKNTLLIHPQQGSYFFLAAMLCTRELPPDHPFSVDYCGACRACLDACPTQAFVQEGVLDSNRCISYLTIEHRGAIDLELRGSMGDWLFGCDVCQEVCPWNRFAAPTNELAFQPKEDRNPINIVNLFYKTNDELRALLKGTALSRAKPQGLLRNAAIVLGNRPCEGGFEALTRGLNHDSSDVRGACAWAMRFYPAKEAITVLNERRQVESQLKVIEEMDSSLAALTANTK